MLKDGTRTGREREKFILEGGKKKILQSGFCVRPKEANFSRSRGDVWGLRMHRRSRRGEGEGERSASLTWITVLDGPVDAGPVGELGCEGGCVGREVRVDNIYELRLGVPLAEVHPTRVRDRPVVIHIGQDQEQGTRSSSNWGT